MNQTMNNGCVQWGNLITTFPAITYGFHGVRYSELLGDFMYRDDDHFE